MKTRALLFVVITFLGVVAQADLDGWIQSQTETSIERLLTNISPDKSKPGAVIASPSDKDPDYYYHWVRDAALVMRTLFQITEETGEDYTDLLLDFARFSRENQLSPAIGGFGEPKFYVDGRPYEGPWGRPQNDGPALRAIVLIQLAQDLLDQGEDLLVQSLLYDSRLPTETVIKADLEFVSHHWEDLCIDLWEEVWGSHFYTRMVQRKALLDGAELAGRLGDTGAQTWYEEQALLLEEKILEHLSIDENLIIPTLDVQDEWKVSHLDTSVILAILHGYADDDFFRPTNEWVLASAHQLKKSFEKIYAINQNGPGIAIGRYPEDRYYGGNPWFLTTLAFVELYARIITDFETLGVIEVTDINADFFGLKPAQTIEATDPRFKKILARLDHEATQFLKRIESHTPQDGTFSEQIHRKTGKLESAMDLTWSYASFLTAIWARGL